MYWRHTACATDECPHLTAAAINPEAAGRRSLCAYSAVYRSFFNDPGVDSMHNMLAHAG